MLTQIPLRMTESESYENMEVLDIKKSLFLLFMLIQWTVLVENISFLFFFHL